MSFFSDQPLSEPTELQLEQFSAQSTLHENHITDSWEEQVHVENLIFDIRRARPPNTSLILHRDKHIIWLQRNLQQLPRGFEPFDALQGWAGFWIVHALDLLGAVVPVDIAGQLVAHFEKCKDRRQGGYGGGPGQTAHLASTFSVLMALCALGTDDALESIDVEGLARFIDSMKLENGAFRVSEGGEVDVRACYCAASIASMIGLLEGEGAERLKKGSGEWLKSLQGFDGGMGGTPGAESHGGNTYCGLAAAIVMGVQGDLDLKRILDWAVMRQMTYEGGFQGRTNKLVDSCYSFWVGGVFALLRVECFDAEALVKYVLECCQVGNGGLRDKPGAARDYMHTCYALSGLSIAEHVGKAEIEGGGVKRVNPLFNLSDDKFEKAWKFFRRG